MDDIDAEKQFYFAEFSKKLALKEVIVGAMSDVTRAELSECLGDLESQVMTINLADRSR